MPSAPVPRSFSKLLLVVVGVLASLLAGLIVVQVRLAESADREVALAAHVGEILRLDELLTMSARLHAAAHDPAWRARYEANVPLLDQELAAALLLVDSAEPRQAVQATEAANKALVELEEQSFALCEEGRWDEALASLTSERYATLKADYARGMGHALELMRRAAAADSQGHELALVLGTLLVAVAFLGAFLFQRHARAHEHEAALRRAQLDALKVTMVTVMDTVNNALNNLQVFRLKADESRDFTPEDLALFDAVITQTAERIRAMGDMAEFRTRSGLGSDMLDVDASPKPVSPGPGPGGAAS